MVTLTPRAMTSPRLLIVDDDPELRNFLSTELRVEGYSCDEAATGQQALGQIRSGGLDPLVHQVAREIDVGRVGEDGRDL